MQRIFVTTVISLLAGLSQMGYSVDADEIAIGAHPNHQSLQELGLDSLGRIESDRSITAGELWQFFHSRGVTSVDRLTLNIDCGERDLSDLTAIGFQIEDPANGNVLTKLSINPQTKRLEVPLDFDYMKRFSPGSQELIRLDLSQLDSLAPATTITVESEGAFFGPFNWLAAVAFICFWSTVFFILNRFTKPTDQEEIEEIIVLSQASGDPSTDEAIASSVPPSANGGSRAAASSINSPLTRTGHSKMISAQ